MAVGICLWGLPATGQDGSAKFGNSSDQVGGGGGGGGGGGAPSGGGGTIKGGHQPPRQKPASEEGIPFNVVLRYYSTKFKPAEVEEKLKKLPGVGAVYFRKDQQQVCVPMKGKLEDASRIKSAFPVETDYLSPVTVSWTLKKDPAVRKSDTSTLKDMIAGQGGVAKVIEASASSVQLKVDLSLFDVVKTMGGVAAECGMTATLDSHEFVTIPYESGNAYQTIVDLCLELKGGLMQWVDHGSNQVTLLVKKGDLKQADVEKHFATRAIKVSALARANTRK